MLDNGLLLQKNLLGMKGAQQTAKEIPLLSSLKEGDYCNTYYNTALLQDTN